MTIAKDFTSKFAVAIVAVAMILTAVAPSARAATMTADELQKTINDLLAQVATLQAQAGGTTPAAGKACGTFSMDLKMGANSADVKNLQMFLNSDPDTRVSATGVGSAGMETMAFGPLTMTAVSKFQVKYRAEILTPAGLVNPTGFFGPGSRAQANKLCAGAPGPTPTPTPGTSTDLQGEASLDDVMVDSADDDTIEEGAQDAEVAVATFNFQDGDASISRMDVSFVPEAGTDPWDILDTVTVMVDGDEIASMDASNRDDYLDEDTGTLRLSSLDIVAMEDEDLDVTIAVTLQDGIDTPDLGDVDVSVDNIRYFDADDVATTEDNVGDLGTPVQFTVEAAGSNDEIIIKTSDTDPNSTTLQLEDDMKSDYYTVFAFDIDTKDSVNDLDINQIPVSIVLSSSTFDSIVDDYELVIDGTTIDTLSDNNGVAAGKYTSGATTILTFDVDGDVTLNAGDRVKAELRLRFKSLGLGNEGITVQGKVTNANALAIDAEGTDNVTDLSGAATGDAHTLRTAGISTETTSDDAVVTTPDLNTNDYGTYTLKVDVTAFNQDVRISTNPATSVSYSLVDGAGTAAVAGTRSITLSSTADENGGFFEINEGETETLTIKVTYTPGVANTAARLQLNSIKFDETGTAPTTDDKTQTTLPATDYRTEVVTMVN